MRVLRGDIGLERRAAAASRVLHGNPDPPTVYDFDLTTTTTTTLTADTTSSTTNLVPSLGMISFSHPCDVVTGVSHGVIVEAGNIREPSSKPCCSSSRTVLFAPGAISASCDLGDSTEPIESGTNGAVYEDGSERVGR